MVPACVIATIDRCMEVCLMVAEVMYMISLGMDWTVDRVPCGAISNEFALHSIFCVVNSTAT